MVHLFGPCGWLGVVVGVSWRWRRKHGPRPDHVWKLGSGIVGDLRYQVRGRFLRANAQRSGANNNDACGCRDPPEGVVVDTLLALELRVKTLDPMVLMPAALKCVVTSLEAVSWSFGSLDLDVFFGGKLDAS